MYRMLINKPRIINRMKFAPMLLIPCAILGASQPCATHLIEWQLISINGLNLTIQLYSDYVTSMFMVVVSMITISVLLFTVNYMKGDPNIVYFLVVLGLFVSSMMKLILCPHLINLMAGWDGLGLSSYLLVIYYMNDKSMAAGMITLMTNRIGDALLILAGALAFSTSGHWSFVQNNYKITSFILILLFMASLTKSAQLPFSAWLPAAMSAPTPVSALVHSSTLVTAGIYLLIRYYDSLNQIILFKEITLIIGVMTCMLASLSALFETDLKKIIALSTLSQLGVMMMSIGMSMPQIAFYHLLTHALFKALLFICAGNIIHSMGDNQDIRLMGNVASVMPFTTTAMNIANLSLCGFPFLAGFYSKDYIIEGFMMSNVSLTTSIMLMMSITMTAAYSARLSILMLWSPFKGVAMKSMDDNNNLIITSYFILGISAISAGAVGYWMFLPCVKPMILPTLLKISTILVISILSISMWYWVKMDKSLSGTHYMTSMWFLGYISSSPLNSKVMTLSNVYMYNELTWMEKLSGKGMFNMFYGGLKKAETYFDFKMSTILSTFTILWFALIIMTFLK